MATKSDKIDLGGMTLIVKGINIADKPHQIGTPADLGGGSIPDPLEVDDLEVASSIELGNLTLNAADMTAVAAGSQADHSHSLEIDINGTTYWIMLSDTNANE